MFKRRSRQVAAAQLGQPAQGQQGGSRRVPYGGKTPLFTSRSGRPAIHSQPAARYSGGDHGCAPPSRPLRFPHCTPHWGTKRAVVEQLLDTGADVDVTDTFVQTLLLLAAGPVRGTVPPNDLAVTAVWAALGARHRDLLPLPASRKRQRRAAATTRDGEQRGGRETPYSPTTAGHPHPVPKHRCAAARRRRPPTTVIPPSYVHTSPLNRAAAAAHPHHPLHPPP